MNTYVILQDFLYFFETSMKEGKYLWFRKRKTLSAESSGPFPLLVSMLLARATLYGCNAILHRHKILLICFLYVKSCLFITIILKFRFYSP